MLQLGFLYFDPHQKNEGSNPLVNKFMESIEHKAFDVELFLKVSTNDGEFQMIKYLHFNDPLFPLHLYGTDLQQKNIQIDVSNISSIEILPKMKELVEQYDKEKLAEIGISLMSMALLAFPREHFNAK